MNELDQFFSCDPVRSAPRLDRDFDSGVLEFTDMGRLMHPYPRLLPCDYSC